MVVEDPMHTKLLAKEKRRDTSSVNTEKYNDNQLISHIITGVKNARQHKNGLAGRVICLPSNISRTHVYAVNRSSAAANMNNQYELSVVTYEHLGKCVTIS